jgi:hypothetical protein
MPQLELLIFFFSFAHPALIEERGIEPMLNIHKTLGEWPVLKGDAWDENKWSWIQSVKDFRKTGYSTDYILDFSIGTDLKNTTRRIIDVRRNKCKSKSVITNSLFIFARLINHHWV